MMCHDRVGYMLHVKVRFENSCKTKSLTRAQRVCFSFLKALYDKQTSYIKVCYTDYEKHTY